MIREQRAGECSMGDCEFTNYSSLTQIEPGKLVKKNDATDKLEVAATGDAVLGVASIEQFTEAGGDFRISVITAGHVYTIDNPTGFYGCVLAEKNKSLRNSSGAVVTGFMTKIGG